MDLTGDDRSLQRSAPNWPRFLWHYRVHRDRVHERLFFFRLRFEPVYDRDAVAYGVRAACEVHGVRAVISYEMFGSFDMLLRVWLPQGRTSADFKETLARELAPAGEVWIDPFAVDYAVRHFLFVDDDGKPLLPHDMALHHLQADEIAEIEEGYPDRVSPELLERVISENLLAPFTPADGDAPSQHPGVKFAIVVSGAPDLNRSQLIAFEQEIVRVLDAATSIGQRSLYTGFGFGHFVIMGRVGYDAYHAIHADLITQLNTAALRGPYRIRTETHVSGQRGYHIAEEGLSGIPGMRDADLRLPDAPAHGQVSRPVVVESELEPGDIFAERFEIRARLGAGGYATVYRAWDPFERVDRALKIFSASDRDAALREISALRRIDHPNVVKPIWAGPAGDRFFYLVTEFIEGRSLRDIDAGELDDLRALEILDQVLAGLEAVHPKDARIAELQEQGFQRELTGEEFDELQRLRAEGLIHRDIKPENIMVGDDDVVRLVDFNIASPARDPKLTRSGTPGYQAPDAGEDRWEPADDLFACGVVLYELLAGAHPYRTDEGKPTGVPIDIRDRREDVSPELGDVVMCACSSSRADRYSTARMMREQLRRQLRVRRAGTEADRIGEALYNRRRSVGLSARQLSSKTGVSAEDIEAFEQAKAQPRLTEALRLAQELELDLYRLIDQPSDSTRERRRFSRVPVDLVIMLAHDSGGPVEAHLRNLSMGGALVETNLAMAAGDQVELDLDLSGVAVSATGTAVRVSGGTAGLELEVPDAAGRAALSRFLGGNGGVDE